MYVIRISVTMAVNTRSSYIRGYMEFAYPRIRNCMYVVHKPMTTTLNQVVSISVVTILNARNVTFLT
jgi:hypothetical protein